MDGEGGVSSFKSGVSDYAAIRKRAHELGIRPIYNPDEPAPHVEWKCPDCGATRDTQDLCNGSCEGGF